MTLSETSEQPTPDPDPWWLRAALPVPTLVTFTAFALVLWLNAAVNPFRFNVALAVLASVPLTVLLVRGALIARRAGRSETRLHSQDDR